MLQPALDLTAGLRVITSYSIHYTKLYDNDGKIIRLNIPRLTEERRRDLTRLVGKRVEEAKVAVRNVRRDVLNDLREMKDEKMISENQFYLSQDDRNNFV